VSQSSEEDLLKKLTVIVDEVNMEVGAFVSLFREDLGNDLFLCVVLDLCPNQNSYGSLSE